MRDTLDRFYTKRSVAGFCFSLIADKSEKLEKPIYIEPSAGDGSFIDAAVCNGIDKKNIIAIDIAPQRDDIIESDWFEYDLFQHDKNILVIIGNPPYGERSALAKKFIQKITKERKSKPTVIAFILPNIFSKEINQKCFGEYRLIQVTSLERSAFLLNKKEFSIPTSLYVLTNINDLCPGIDFREYKAAQPKQYSFMKRDSIQADFTINGNSGKVKELSEVTNPKAEHFIKVSEDYDVGTVKQMFKALKYQKRSSCSGGNYWLNRNDINKAFIEKYGQQ